MAGVGRHDAILTLTTCSMIVTIAPIIMAPVSPKRALALASRNVQHRVQQKNMKTKTKRKTDVFKVLVLKHFYSFVIFFEVGKEMSLTTETVSATYWKDLAEERRAKLETAMEENKDLAEMLQVWKFFEN